MPSWLRYLFIAALALAGISLFGLAATSSDSKQFEKWFPLLSIVNRAIAVLLFAVVVAMVVRLWQRIRAREFGAYMTTKLAGVIALIVLIPCLTIYVVSNVFISRSIDSWFDVRVERMVVDRRTVCERDQFVAYVDTAADHFQFFEMFEGPLHGPLLGA